MMNKDSMESTSILEMPANHPKFSGGGARSSNLELFRIITMLVIIAHLYVVNSGLTSIIYDSSSLSAIDYFLLIFGWGGKTGINCFVLIIGYFMSTFKITAFKYGKLVGE